MISVADPSRRLPPETFSHILSFLKPPSLVRCAQVSRAWNEVCTDEAVWRALALRLGYCQLERAAEELESGIRVVASVLQRFDPNTEPDPSEDLLQATIQRYRSRNNTAYFDDCESWRSLCTCVWRLGLNWSPRQPTGVLKPAPMTRAWETKAVFRDLDISALRRCESPPTTDREIAWVSERPKTISYLFPQRRVLHFKQNGSGVWRCKIDPEERTFIVTGQNGGIQVFDHSTKTLLWHIPRTATRSSSHLEFSRGWFIFDRPGIGHFEVWRSERLVPDLGRAPDRGHYQRFTILSSTRPIRAYRFQFPYLCAASQDGFITIWDVPQQEVVETIDMRDSAHRGGNITYIDFDDEFVFLNGIGAKSVSVFSRRTQRLVWSLGQHFASGASPPTTWSLKQCRLWGQGHEPVFWNPALMQRQLERAPPGPWQAGPNTMNSAQLTMAPYQIWSAVHPDLMTRTLLILGQGTILLIRDYKKFFRNPGQRPELFAEIEFENMPDYYHSHILNGQEDWSGLGWNRRLLWVQRGDAQLTVHEGKAVIINHFPVFLDLNSEAAAMHFGEGDTALEPETRSSANNLPDGSQYGPDQSVASPIASPHRSSDERNRNENSSERNETSARIPVLLYTQINGPVHDSYDRCSSVQMDEVGVYVTLDKDTTEFPVEEDEEMNIDELTGDDRVLLHFDFTKRHELTYNPDEYPSLFPEYAAENTTVPP
ncbi:hypothetical protein NDA10_004999 [Ustilago hordei]|nr:hypothetical protein NDA10_004999 [Ustilago hordei]UTT92482.1 hypothetical protein NDA17_000132 [Ustilago hordei]